jgi:hypothetical protein
VQTDDLHDCVTVCMLLYTMWLELWSHAPFFEGPMGANATFRDTFEQ